MIEEMINTIGKSHNTIQNLDIGWHCGALHETNDELAVWWTDQMHIQRHGRIFLDWQYQQAGIKNRQLGDDYTQQNENFCTKIMFWQH